MSALPSPSPRRRPGPAGRAAALAALAVLAACGGDGPARGNVELRLLFQVDSLESPESVAWDSARGRYLITSIAGQPDAADGNGFVTSVPHDGGPPRLRRYDSSTPGLTLDAPRGIAVAGDRAYLADIRRVVALDLAADTAFFSREIPESGLLNDVVVGPDGSVFVSDTRGDAVFRVSPDGSSHRRVPAAGSLRGPDGLAVDPGTGDLVVAGGEGAILRLSREGPVSLVAEPRRAQALDGVQLDPTGGILFTDRPRGTLERLPPGTEAVERVEPVLWLEDLPAPADFLLRDTVLAVPEMGAGRARFYRVLLPGGNQSDRGGS